MTILDYRKTLPGGMNQPQSSKSCELTRTVDFAEYPMANGDVMLVFDVPAGFLREQTDVFLLTAEGGTATIDIGTSGAADTFLDGGNINGADNTLLARGTNYDAARKLYTSATPLQIMANNALDAARILIVVRGYMTGVR